MKIRLLNSVYEFVFAIQEVKLEINHVVSRGSSVDKFQAVCSEVSIRWHHAVVVKMFVSSLLVREVFILENEIEKNFAFITTKSKQGSGPAPFK